MTDWLRTQLLRQRDRLPTLLTAALSILLLLSHPLWPERRLVLLPSDEIVTELYGFDDGTTGRSAQWVDEPAQHWRCHYRQNHSYGCGWLLRFADPERSGSDISRFEAMEVTLDYQGPAKRLRLMAFNTNPAYSYQDEINHRKPMGVLFSVEEAKAPVRVSLAEFNVASWWLLERAHRGYWSAPEWTNIEQFGVDVVETGEHELRVNRLVLVGRWIKTETLLLIVLSLWMAVFLGQGGTRFYRLYREAQNEHRAIQDLQSRQFALTEENSLLETLADTDPLTGVHNRAGLRHRLAQENNLAGLGILLLDIDYFKRLNDTYGHDVGDKVLKALAALLSINLREEDIFARLGGEEFVVVCRRQAPDRLLAFAEKLRQLAMQCAFSGERGLHISVSIGVTLIAQEENFKSALERADQALYQAKHSGRNRVEYVAEPE